MSSAIQHVPNALKIGRKVGTELRNIRFSLLSTVIVEYIMSSFFNLIFLKFKFIILYIYINIHFPSVALRRSGTNMTVNTTVVGRFPHGEMRYLIFSLFRSA